jgi:hypothetical protein
LEYQTQLADENDLKAEVNNQLAQCSTWY